MKKSWTLYFKSVGVKLFVILFSSIVLLSSVLGLTSYFAAKNIITNEVAAASTQSVVQAADKLDFVLAEYEALSRQFALDSVLKGDLEKINSGELTTVDKAGAEDRIRRKLDLVKGSDERMYGVRLVSKSLVDSESYKSAGISGIRSDEGISARLEQIAAAKGEPVWFPVREKGFFDAYTEPSLTMGRLLRNLVHPEAEYYMLIEVKGKAMTEMLSNLQIGMTGEIRILSADGSIVYGVDQAKLGQPSYIKVSEEQGKEQNHSFTAEDENGSSQLVVYQPLATAKWTLMGYAPVSDFTKSADKLLYITFSVVLAAALIALLIGYILVRLVGRPLGKLAVLMEEGEHGNLQVRTHFKGKDEIGRLGHSFNKMMEQISLLARQSGNSADEVLLTSEQLVQASSTISLHAREVATATGEIAAGSASLAVEAERSYHNVEIIGSKMSEVTEINTVMDHSAERVIEVSNQGTELMKLLVEQSESTVEMINRIQDNSTKLRESTHLIRSILSPMIAVNKQTNILALNATIEAVRAGAAGRGFIVIADEIRQLANQSNESIQSVSKITEEIGLHIENTVKDINEAAPKFREQISSVRESSTIFASVKEEMEHFMRHISESSASVLELIEFQRQLGESMASVSSIVQQTTASTEEVASMSSQQFTVSEELVALSEKLEGLAADLKHSLVSFQV
ncbi:methyl-accepting chemotaxis protein [Paenibacillus odorifer]|uniref:methyl-accepting chemotaxis protein n=1 Tax=Paenibacillus odorifer TaxID=189426 RepID=UPI00068E19B8|nr:methyl-accepting chemotaxis protein [Paenibacillus odorifer]